MSKEELSAQKMSFEVCDIGIKKGFIVDRLKQLLFKSNDGRIEQTSEDLSLDVEMNVKMHAYSKEYIR